MPRLKNAKDYTDYVDFEIEEQISIEGGGAKIEFVETLTGLPKPVVRGREPYRWSFTMIPIRDSGVIETLKSWYASGTALVFTYDMEGYNVVITDLRLEDYGEYVNVSITLQEVDVREAIVL